jgi:nicotinate-nucleotide adenylyltransferase
VTGLFGSIFDPPHVGHLALLRSAREHFDLERVVVLVVADPGHKAVETDGSVRLALAALAFPNEEVELDPHPRTVDMLRERRFDDPIFFVGADEFCDFPRWKDPNGVLESARLGVATRPGYPRDRLDRVLGALDRPERVTFFEIEPLDVSSSEIRTRVARGQPIEGLVPPAVAAEIERLGLYRADGAPR